MQKYVQSCSTEFWQQVFRAESAYLLRSLEGSRTVLSVGCGPAIIEADLSGHGLHVTGLDISREALECAPDQIRTIAVRAEDMDFPRAGFDAAIYVASLQFIEDYGKALEKTAHAVRPGGKLIAMLLNPESAFFRERHSDPGSYVNRIRHTDLKEIEREIGKYFSTRTEYFLGLKENGVFPSNNPAEAALYVIQGTRKPLEKDMVRP